MIERESDGVLQRAVLGFAGLRGPAVPMPAGGARPVCRSTLALAVVGACLGALERETDRVLLYAAPRELRVLQRLGWGCTAGGRRAHGTAAGFSPIPSGHAPRRLSGRATERCYVWSQGMAPSRPATCAEPVPGAVWWLHRVVLVGYAQRPGRRRARQRSCRRARTQRASRHAASGARKGNPRRGWSAQNRGDRLRTAQTSSVGR
ncbi:hypothetical protein FHY18_003699 [Xanthomonas arboricola]|nr:hypothetical protein [Xanthomonas sp. 3793]